MKLTTILTVALCLAFAGTTLQADVITLSGPGPDGTTPDFDSNRIVQNGSTLNSPNRFVLWNRSRSRHQHSLVNITSTLITSALESALGASAGGYTINSAILTLQDPDNNAIAGATAHKLLISFNPTTLTWDNFGVAAGPDADVDYDSAIAATATASGAALSFDFTTLFQSYADGTVNANGFYFSPTAKNVSLDDPADLTETSIVLTIDAVAVPEPATMSLLALGGIAMLRRKKRA